MTVPGAWLSLKKRDKEERGREVGGWVGWRGWWAHSLAYGSWCVTEYALSNPTPVHGMKSTGDVIISKTTIESSQPPPLSISYLGRHYLSLSCHSPASHRYIIWLSWQPDHSWFRGEMQGAGAGQENRASFFMIQQRLLGPRWCGCKLKMEWELTCLSGKSILRNTFPILRCREDDHLDIIAKEKNSRV